MLKAICSRKSVFNEADGVYSLFLMEVKDLLYTQDVQNLCNYHQHVCVSRLHHSISVAYHSFLICRKLGLDSRAAARGGLLHDLFFYNSRDAHKHWRTHPYVAVRNAEELTDLTETERDIIQSHMWPLNKRPGSAESYVVCFCDKIVASLEGICSVFLKFTRKDTITIYVHEPDFYLHSCELNTYDYVTDGV